MVRTLIFLVCALTVFSANAELSVSVDRNPVLANESFRLTIKSDSRIDTDPDLSVLKRDFDVLGQNKNTNIKYEAGEWRRSTNIILNLIAKTAGEFTIPVLEVGGQRTEPIYLRVLEAAPDRTDVTDLFLEVEADKERSLVQEQILLTVRLLRTVELGKATLSEPELSAGAVIQELGKDRNYHVERNDQRFAVIERQFAIYPQASGELKISPFVFEGQIVTGGRSFFDPFGQSVSTRRLESEAIVVQVDPVPAEFTGDTWLPARALELNEVWSDDGAGAWTVGTPITRTVAVIARGLTAGQLPELTQSLPERMKAYPEPPALNDQAGADGVIGVRQEKIALIPSSPGELLLPAIELNWWNTHTNQEEIAVLPARAITVAPNPDATPVDDDPAPAGDQPTTADSTTEPDSESAREAQNHLWKLATGILALSWFITLILWRQAANSPKTVKTEAISSKTQGKTKFRELCHLIEHGDPGEISDALIHWGGQEWPQDPPRSLGTLASRVSAGLEAELNKLSATLYGKTSGAIDRESLLRELNSWHEYRPHTGMSGIERSTLEPLFRHGSG